MTRRRWDYFVRYLAGGTPPTEYQMKPFGAVMSMMRDGSDPDSGDEDMDSDLEP